MDLIANFRHQGSDSFDPYPALDSAIVIRQKTILKILLFPVVLIVGIELLLQVAALVVAATGREMPTGWSTEHIRVLALGDSNTFGIYLSEEESYPSQLEALWNARHPHRPIEVLNLGYPGINSFRVADNLDEIIKKFKPDAVLLTIGVNDTFTASEFLEAKTDASGETVVWEPLSMLRRYSRLYKLSYMARQGATANDEKADVTSVTSTEHGEATVNSRDMLTWSDDPKERLEKIIRFKVANSEPTGGLTGLVETVTYGDKKIVMVTDKENLHPPGKERGFGYLDHNLSSIKTRVESTGAAFYLLTYAASAGMYEPANTEIRRYVANSHGGTFIDVATELGKTCPKSADCTDLFFEDFHPKAKGYEKVASIVAQALERDAGFSD